MVTLQQNLFGAPARSATAMFDKTRRYRYQLGRVWDEYLPTCAFIMLNPSTADEHHLDPTVRKCIGFAKLWGFGSIEVGNLFAFRATNPNLLYEVDDPVGPDNDAHLQGIQVRANRVVCAWGNHGALRDRGDKVRGLLCGKDLHCLDFTNEGQPKHPLYVKGTTEPRVFQVHAGGRP